MDLNVLVDTCVLGCVCSFGVLCQFVLGDKVSFCKPSCSGTHLVVLKTMAFVLVLPPKG